jgi:hypothetical protein
MAETNGAGGEAMAIKVAGREEAQFESMVQWTLDAVGR